MAREGSLAILSGSELQSDLRGTKKANKEKKSINISELAAAFSCP